MAKALNATKGGREENMEPKKNKQILDYKIKQHEAKIC